jgi:UDP-N-acetyl-D-galactosamine dehydrogenase
VRSSKRRRGGVRVDRLSGRDRGSLRADHRARIGPQVQRDFYAGYSPERINPGDKQHRLDTILKVTSGSTPEAADFVDALYGSIVSAGTHKASSIRVAEAAKVIENTQRDVNIALINELALIFNRLGIDTERGAGRRRAPSGTSCRSSPGLVGGHCIGVDPYYLTHKAQADRLSPGGDPGGRAHQRRHGRSCRRARGQADDAPRIHVAGAHPRAGRDVQGELPRPAQHARRRRGAPSCSYDAEVDVYDPWVRRRGGRHEYGLDRIRIAATAGTTR